MGVIRLSTRLYEIILEDAAQDGVSLTYAADRVYDRLLEVQGQVAKAEEGNRRLKMELSKKPKVKVEKKIIEVPTKVSKKLLRTKLTGPWGGEISDTRFLHYLYETLKGAGIVLED